MSKAPMSGGAAPRRRGAEWALGLLLALLALWPLASRRGFTLVGDMVFVPVQPWKDTWTGGDGAVPRAVPSDAWVSAASHVIGGEVLQRLVLLGIVLGAVLGICRLLERLPFMARAAAAVMFVWSPYVYERLAVGHWALLCGYAALPWAAWAVLRIRASGASVGGDRRAWGVLVAASAVAAASSPTGGALVALVAVVLLAPLWRAVGWTLLITAVVNLPWLVPAFVNTADQLPPDVWGVEAFAARADTPWGLLVSVMTSGGIWKVPLFPDERSSWVWSGVAVAFLVMGVTAFVSTARRRVPGAWPLAQSASLAAISLVLALVGAFEATRPLAEWVVATVPGGGLVRDGQKWIAPWWLLASVGVGFAVAGVMEWARSRDVSPRLLALPFVVLPLAALPSMVMGAGGFLPVERFPEEWHSMKERMEALDVAQENVVAWPFSTYRQFDWTRQPVLDPAPRFFPGNFILDDTLVVDGGAVRGESALSAEIAAAQGPDEARSALDAANVSWLLLHTTRTPAEMPTGAVLVEDGEQVSLWSLPREEADAVVDGGAGEDAEGAGKAEIFLALDLAVLLVTLLSIYLLFRGSKHSSLQVRSVYTPS